MAADRGLFGSLKAIVTERDEERRKKAERIKKDFLFSKQTLLNGTEFEKHRAFVHLIVHHLVRTQEWIMKEVSDNKLRDAYFPSEKSNKSIAETLRIIRAGLEKNKKSLLRDEQYALSILAYFGELTEKENDYAKSVELAKLAADKGLAVAQTHLAMCCHMGHGANIAKRELDWLLLAQHHAHAQSRLGEYYIRENNYSKAEEWLIKAAAQGDAEGQCKLGELYLSGFDAIKQDSKKAIELLTASAEQDYALAQYYLGILFCNPNFDNSQEIYKKGLEWYAKAAAQYNAEALYQLALHYVEGVRAEDMLMALACLELSKGAGFNFPEHILEDAKNQYIENRSYVPENFVRNVSYLLCDYVVRVRNRYQINPANAVLLAKTFNRALFSNAAIEKAVHDQAILSLNPKQVVSFDEEKSELKETSLKAAIIFLPPENIGIQFRYLKAFYDDLIIKMILQVEPTERTLKEDENKQFVTIFLDTILPFVTQWIMKFQDAHLLKHDDAEVLFRIFAYFLQSNADLNEKISQSSALATISPRDALVYRSLGLLDVINHALTGERGSKELANMILHYLFPAELIADLEESLFVTPTVADALRKITLDDVTICVEFNSKQCRNAFFYANQSSHPFFQTAVMTEPFQQNKKTEVDDSLHRYGLKFTANAHHKFNDSKEKFRVVENYVVSQKRFS